MSHSTRDVSTRVLPDPAPAIRQAGVSRACSTANRCSVFNSICVVTIDVEDWLWIDFLFGLAEVFVRRNSEHDFHGLTIDHAGLAAVDHVNAHDDKVLREDSECPTWSDVGHLADSVATRELLSLRIPLDQ